MSYWFYRLIIFNILSLYLTLSLSLSLLPGLYVCDLISILCSTIEHLGYQNGRLYLLWWKWNNCSPLVNTYILIDNKIWMNFTNWIALNVFNDVWTNDADKFPGYAMPEIGIPICDGSSSSDFFLQVHLFLQCNDLPESVFNGFHKQHWRFVFFK